MKAARARRTPPPADATTVTTTCAPRGDVTPAPADTDTPPAATGPYLWKNVNITAGGFVSGIVFSPAQRDVVYARTDIGGAYRWNPAAQKWVPLLDWVTRANNNWAGVESIAADPLDANKVYVAAGTYLNSSNTAILRSNDQGRTFQSTTMTIPMGGNADGRSVGERLIVDPNQTDTLYFGSRTMGLWKSTDGAVTWSRLMSFPGAATTPNTVGIAFVVLDPLSCGTGGQTTVYVGLGATGTSIYQSNDGGASWAAPAGQPTTLLPSHAAVSATGKLYVTYGGGTGVNGDGPNNVITGAVYQHGHRQRRLDQHHPEGAGGPDHLRVLGRQHRRQQPQHASWSARSTAGAPATTSIRSTDGGATWTPLNVTAAPHDISAAPWVTFHSAKPNYTGWMADVEIDPFNSSRILYVTGQGIWASDDMSALDANLPMHWDFRSVGIEETAVLELASPPAGPPLLSAVGDIGGFRHDDVDVSPASGMSSNPVMTSTDGIDFAELAPNIVARVGRVGSTPTGALSTDGGATWARFATLPPAAAGVAGTIAVSADGATLIWDLPAGTRATATIAGRPAGIARPRRDLDAQHRHRCHPPGLRRSGEPEKFYALDSTGTTRRASTSAPTRARPSPPRAATGLPRGTVGPPARHAGHRGRRLAGHHDRPAPLDRLGRDLHRGGGSDRAGRDRLRKSGDGARPTRRCT